MQKLLFLLLIGSVYGWSSTSVWVGTLDSSLPVNTNATFQFACAQLDSTCITKMCQLYSNLTTTVVVASKSQPAFNVTYIPQATNLNQDCVNCGSTVVGLTFNSTLLLAVSSKNITCNSYTLDCTYAVPMIFQLSGNGFYLISQKKTNCIPSC
jgi:hypothetical protein